MSKRKPEYDINDFVKACKADSHKQPMVTLERGVQQQASKDFSLKTRGEIVSFIARGGLEKLEYINSRPYQLSRDVPPPICDAYNFYSGFALGYISFFFSKSIAKWIIKSFHRDGSCGPTAMEEALRRAGLLPDKT